LHANSIIYCDLKPSNVLLNEYSTLKLCDFGLARKLVDLDSSQTKDESDLVDEPKAKSGTPYYMAPELFTDDGVHSFQSDVWALGCILFEMATGKPPFAASSL
jgi:serine/threonine-protein kinase ULK4